MPKFWKRKTKCEDGQSLWFVKISNETPPPPSYTFQLKPTAMNILQDMGLGSGDYFDWGQFWTLYDLGQTYTLGEDTKTDISATLSEAKAEELPPKHRIAFVQELLREYKVEDVLSDGFYRLLHHIEEGSKEPRFELLEFLLEDTPLDSATPDGLAQDPTPVFSSSVFGALVCRAFDEFLSDYEDESTERFEPIAHDGEYAYAIMNRDEWNQIPCLADFSIDIPQAYVEEIIPQNDSKNWERDIINAIHEYHFLGASAGRAESDAGHLIFNGLEESRSESSIISPKCLIVVPQSLLVDSSIRSLI
jgi:hypothetical protein